MTPAQRDHRIKEQWEMACRVFNRSHLGKLIADQICDELEAEGVTEADIDRLFPERQKAVCA